LGNSDEAEAEPRNSRFQDLYKTIGEVHLVCLLVDAETIEIKAIYSDG
jgi:hypothetical protein